MTENIPAFVVLGVIATLLLVCGICLLMEALSGVALRKQVRKINDFAKHLEDHSVTDKRREGWGIKPPGPCDFDQYPNGRYVDPKNDDPAELHAYRSSPNPPEVVQDAG